MTVGFAVSLFRDQDEFGDWSLYRSFLIFVAGHHGAGLDSEAAPGEQFNILLHLCIADWPSARSKLCLNILDSKTALKAVRPPGKERKTMSSADRARRRAMKEQLTTWVVFVCSKPDAFRKSLS